MESPCCGLIYHASCGVKKLADSAHLNHRVNCECGALLFQCDDCFSEITPEAETTIEAVMAKPEVPAQIKAIKAKFTAEGKARAAYMKYLKTQRTEFSQTVETHMAAIKQLKGNMLNTIKASEEFKSYRRLRASAFLAKNKFSTEHSIRGRVLRKLFMGSDWGRWYDTPVSMFRRRFRIRL